MAAKIKLGGLLQISDKIEERSINKKENKTGN